MFGSASPSGPQNELAHVTPEVEARTAQGQLPAWAMAAAVAVLFSGIVGYAKFAGYRNGDIPDYVYRQPVPQANEASHPADNHSTIISEWF